MELGEIKNICEAFLFASNKPVRIAELKDILGVDQKMVKLALDQISEDYKKDAKSFAVSEVAGGYVITTLPEYGVWLKKLFKDKYSWRLSEPALETLAIIAYRQPITRAEIELIRGVNVDGVVNTLLERDLIKISGRKEVIGRPLLYGTTKEFLEYFGLNNLRELPPLEEIVIPKQELPEELQSEETEDLDPRETQQEETIQRENIEEEKIQEEIVQDNIVEIDSKE